MLGFVPQPNLQENNFLVNFRIYTVVDIHPTL
jgi:hypothetical protein